MKTNTRMTLSIMAVAGILILIGCGKKKQPVGVGERTGVALDEAAKKSAAKTEQVAAKIKDATGKVVEKTGEAVEKAGAAVDQSGAALQK